MSSRVTFGTIKRVGAILIAIAVVLAAGIVVGQAPAIFGVETDPDASITFEDQQQDGDSVVIDEVTLSDGGFVVVSDNNGETLVVSNYLDADTHENVTIELEDDSDVELVGQLTATVHQDTSGDESYTYEQSDGDEDQPYLENGVPVSDTATVTTTQSGDALSDSFTVDNISAPSSATTNETIEVSATVTNPTELQTQQNVEFRLDGAVIEQQTVDLEGKETSEVTFEIDTSGSPAGEQPIGVYTEGDGAVTTIDLEFHTDPGVEIVGADDENVTADVAIPAEGFVAIENAEGNIIGASDDLTPGEHDNVTVEFDNGSDVADDEELTAVLYEGESADPEAATPLEDEDSGERIQTTFTLADVADTENGDDNGSDDSNGNGSDGGDDEDA